MIATGHSAVGFAIGVIVVNSPLINDPLVAAAIGGGSAIALHYVEDFIPHGHFVTDPDKISKSPITYIDVITGIGLFVFEAVGLFGVSLSSLIIILAVGGSLLPDVVSALLSGNYHQAPKNYFAKLEYRLHNWVHWHGTGRNTLPLGWYDIWQVTVILFAVFLPFWT